MDQNKHNNHAQRETSENCNKITNELTENERPLRGNPQLHVLVHDEEKLITKL